MKTFKVFAITMLLPLAVFAKLVTSTGLAVWVWFAMVGLWLFLLFSEGIEE